MNVALDHVPKELLVAGKESEDAQLDAAIVEGYEPPAQPRNKR